MGCLTGSRCWEVAGGCVRCGGEPLPTWMGWGLRGIGAGGEVYKTGTVLAHMHGVAVPSVCGWAVSGRSGRPCARVSFPFLPHTFPRTFPQLPARPGGPSPAVAGGPPRLRGAVQLLARGTPEGGAVCRWVVLSSTKQGTTRCGGGEGEHSGRCRPAGVRRLLRGCGTAPRLEEVPCYTVLPMQAWRAGNGRGTAGAQRLGAAAQVYEHWRQHQRHHSNGHEFQTAQCATLIAAGRYDCTSLLFSVPVRLHMLPTC